MKFTLTVTKSGEARLKREGKRRKREALVREVAGRWMPKLFLSAGEAANIVLLGLLTTEKRERAQPYLGYVGD